MVASVTSVQSTFQFHKGTIKTVEIERMIFAFKDFNSIKVQLKPTLF